MSKTQNIRKKVRKPKLQKKLQQKQKPSPKPKPKPERKKPMPPETPDNTLPGEGNTNQLTQEELAAFGASLKAILSAMKDKIQELRREDRDLTCEEVAQVIAVGLPSIGRLCDELIADIKD